MKRRMSSNGSYKPMVQQILDYYLKNLSILPFKTQFHFLSRMYLWTRDEAYLNRLNSLKAEYAGISKQEQTAKIKQYLQTFQLEYLRYGEKRNRFIEEIPELIPTGKALSVWLFLKTVYKENIRNVIVESVKDNTLESYIHYLQTNREAWYYLSTYATNFMYFVSFYKPDLFRIEIKEFMAVFHEFYDKNDKVNVQIGCYFLSHCIIAASWFYAKPITRNKSGYQRMVEKLGYIIEQNFNDISLDIKCEYLVCLMICQMQNTVLEEKIGREVRQNWDGEIIIDPYVTTSVTDLPPAVRYEHTNVLYVMSKNPFSR